MVFPAKIRLGEDVVKMSFTFLITLCFVDTTFSGYLKKYLWWSSSVVDVIRIINENTDVFVDEFGRVDWLYTRYWTQLFNKKVKLRIDQANKNMSKFNDRISWIRREKVLKVNNNDYKGTSVTLFCHTFCWTWIDSTSSVSLSIVDFEHVIIC